MSLDELTAVLTGIGEASFRAKQVYEWLWKKGVHSFDAMHTVSKRVRHYLSDHFLMDGLSVGELQKSDDQSIKCALKGTDGSVIEGVLIPTASRVTACVSSQVGCSLACTFCATGRLKLKRNLMPGEMYDQVLLLRRLSRQHFRRDISNVVFMGMGEPLLNYNHLMRGIERITAPTGAGISPQRITVSTAGIAKKIRQLGDDKVKFHLALSLHAADDAKRSALMAINDSNNLQVLTDALKYFHAKTQARTTLEYCLLDGFNDAPEDARQLVQFAKCAPVKINLIAYNPIDDGLFHPSPAEKVTAFAHYLERHHLVVNIRRSRGKDIDAACGQLANKNQTALLKDERLR